MKRNLLILFILFIGVSASAQTPKKEQYSFENTVWFKSVPYNSGAGIVALGIDTVSGSATYGKLVRKTAGSSGSFINNQNSAAQSSSNFWISGNGRIQGKLLIASVGYSAQAATNKLEIDSNVLIWGAHSDNTSKILDLRAANGGARFSVDGGGYATFNNLTAPTVNADISVGINGGLFVGDDAGGVVWLNRYSSSEQYGEIYNVQARNSAGTAGFRVFTHNSGTQFMPLSIEATGETKFLTTVSPQANDGAALGSTSLKWSDLFLASGAVINFNSGNATITHSSSLLTSNVDFVVPDEAYDATAWNGSLEVPTKNAIRDKIEAMSAGVHWDGIFNGTFETAGTPVTLGSFPVMINAYNTSSSTYTLPAISGGTSFFIKNASTQNLTVQRAASDQIWTTSAVTSEVLAPGESRLYVSGATYWYSYFAGSASTAAISTLSDVTLTSLASGDFLKYNGSAWVNRTAANVRTDLGLVIGTNVQAYDADLDTWAGITPGSNVGTFLATPSSANLKTAITDETGTGGALVFATSPTLTTPIIADLGFISDANGNELLRFDNVAAATNEFTISNEASGAPVLSVTGDDANINMGFRVKGTGGYLFSATASGAAYFNIYEDTDNGSDFIKLTAPSSLSGSPTITLPNSSSTLPIYTQQITYAGPSTARTITYPDANITVARSDAAQTFTGTQTFSAIVTTNNAITASGNAATVPVTSNLSTVTNNSAATLTITLTTASAVDGQMVTVRVLDFSAAAQTITWVNTENSSIAAPTTSNGSTTLFLTVRFIYNSATSKWRCIGYA